VRGADRDGAGGRWGAVVSGDWTTDEADEAVAEIAGRRWHDGHWGLEMIAVRLRGARRACAIAATSADLEEAERGRFGTRMLARSLRTFRWCARSARAIARLETQATEGRIASRWLAGMVEGGMDLFETARAGERAERILADWQAAVAERRAR